MPTRSTDDPPAGEPFVEEKLDRALAPYAGLLPPEVLADFRGTLADFMTSHPPMARMLARLRPRPAVDVSGDQPTGGADEEAVPAASGSRK